MIDSNNMIVVVSHSNNNTHSNNNKILKKIFSISCISVHFIYQIIIHYDADDHGGLLPYIYIYIYTGGPYMPYI